MKKTLILFLSLSLILCFVSCEGAESDADSKLSLEESLRESFGDMYDGLDSGILMEGSLNSYWKLNENNITLFGEGAFVSMAAGFFPWRTISEHIVSIHIENGVTSVGAYGFFDYENLLEVTVEDGSFVRMGMGCFGQNKNLKKVSLGNILEEIPAEAFIRCGALEEITIPATVSKIGLDAFKDCDSLKTIHFGGSEADWNAITVEDGNEALNRARIIFG